MAVELDLGELLGMARAGGSGKRTRKTHPLHPEGQKMELLDRYRRGAIKANLKPGDLCRDKAGLNLLIHAPVLILWRWLDMEDRHDRVLIKEWLENHFVMRVDCLVGYLSDDGRDVHIMPHESWRLEKIADSEK